MQARSDTSADALDCPLSHGACKEPASPAPSLPCRVLDARRRANSRATAQCVRPPLLLLPRRRCATALASDKPCSPACGLQAATSSHPAPRQRLRPWLCRSCCRRPGIAVHCPCLAWSRTARRLRRQLRSRLRRLRWGHTVSSLRSTAHRRAGVNRKRLNITAHYPK